VSTFLFLDKERDVESVTMLLSWKYAGLGEAPMVRPNCNAAVGLIMECFSAAVAIFNICS
jgi:hypothetical protein